jgi:hypothetical protein
MKLRHEFFDFFVIKAGYLNVESASINSDRTAWRWCETL